MSYAGSDDPKATDLPARLSSRIKVAETGCWEWAGARASNGYGSVSFQGRTWSTHRLVYTLLVGPVPIRRQLDHLCMNRICCRPSHLEPVTGSVNQSRARAARTRCPRMHPMTGRNVRVNAKGHRSCRRCASERQRERRTAARADRLAAA